MPLYFAYGANMNREAMARRCPRSSALVRARLARHRLAVMREGWLTVVRDPRASVHGVLWDVALSDVPPLDRYEGLAQGLYAKIAQPVLTEFGAKAGAGLCRRQRRTGDAASGLSGRGPCGGARLAVASRGDRSAGAVGGRTLGPPALGRVQRISGGGASQFVAASVGAAPVVPPRLSHTFGSS